MTFMTQLLASVTNVTNVINGTNVEYVSNITNLHHNIKCHPPRSWLIGTSWLLELQGPTDHCYQKCKQTNKQYVCKANKQTIVAGINFYIYKNVTKQRQPLWHSYTIIRKGHKCHPIASDLTKPKQTRPDQTKPNQTKLNQTKLYQNQTKPNHTKQNKTKQN